MLPDLFSQQLIRFGWDQRVAPRWFTGTQHSGTGAAQVTPHRCYPYLEAQRYLSVLLPLAYRCNDPFS